MGMWLKTFALSLLIAGCSHVPVALTEDGEKVKIVKSVPDNNQYTFLGEVYCELGWNAISSAHNMEGCRIDLKNKAGSKGATHLEIITQAGDPYSNQVTMSGNAYKKISNNK